jgi:F420H(2)-dependent quinone reductase
MMGSLQEQPMVISTITMIGTSPRWVSSFDSVALRMPGVQQVLGQQLALMTGTGAVSGRLSTTAAQRIRDRGSYVVTAPVRRRWRRNIESVPS